VSLIRLKAEVKCVISDNGLGFNAEENLENSLGLVIIQEHSEEIWAILRINGELRKGAEIEVIWKKVHNN